MRDLTPEELDMISGGYDPNEDIVVTAPGYHPTFPPPSYYPPPGGYYPSYPPPPYGGGPAPSPAAHTHTSPGGVLINYDGNLTSDQVKMMDQIADYGKAHGYSNGQIWNAIQQAYHESRLGANWGDNATQSRDGTHFGLFQYDQSSFSTWNSGGNIHSNADQIAAIYKEFDTFSLERYQSGVAAGKITGVSYDEYLEYKHHQPQGDGGVTVGTAWTTYQPAYDNDSYTGPDAIKLKTVNK